MTEVRSHPPIFLLGVPRSGTTLLRTILDSHSAIAAGPETPWLANHQPASLGNLWRFLTADPLGYCASYHMPAEVATAACRRLAGDLLAAYAASRGKRRWVEKTPDNLKHLDFIRALFPDARFLVIVRDGLDVALSTSVVAEHRRGIDPWLERNLDLGGQTSVRNTPFAALLRWRHWNAIIDRGVRSAAAHRIRYEDLVTSPHQVLRDLCAFLDEPFEPTMIDYTRAQHHFPSWEWGSADVVAHRGISTGRVGRAERELTPAQLDLLRPIADPSSTLHLPWTPLHAEQFATWLDDLAIPLGLPARASTPHAEPIARLWGERLAHVRWDGLTLAVRGGAASALPIVLAHLGASIVLTDGPGEHLALWTKLRDAARLRIDLGPSDRAADRTLDLRDPSSPRFE